MDSQNFPILKTYADLYNWDLIDSPLTATVVFKHGIDLNSNFFHLTFDSKLQVITVYYDIQRPPLFAGKFFSSIESASIIQYSKNETHIVLKKMKEEKWNMIFQSPLNDGTIDPQSAYQLYVAFNLLTPDDSDQPSPESMKYLQKSAEMGYLPSIKILSDVFIQNESTFPSAILLLEDAIKNYDSYECALKLGLIYSYRLNNPKLALEMLTVASKHNVPGSHTILGRFYSPFSDMVSTEKNISLAKIEFEKALMEDNNDEIAKNELEKLSSLNIDDHEFSNNKSKYAEKIAFGITIGLVFGVFYLIKKKYFHKH